MDILIRDHTYIYEVHTEGGGGQKNKPQIADTGTFKVRNWAKIVDFKQFYADVINVWSLNCILIKKSVSRHYDVPINSLFNTSWQSFFTSDFLQL